MRIATKWWWTTTATIGFAALCCALGAAGPTPAYVTVARSEITSLPAAPIVPHNSDDLRAIQARVEAVVKEAVPATVAILLDDAQGSGVIVSKDGYVLTAGHVSGKPGQSMLIVLANGKRLRAKALGANNNIDSGMVKILDPAPAGGFPCVPLGSAKGLQAGQWVVAMGHPGGYDEERPAVVRLGRVLLANRLMIGTDCPLIGGDSGGPLFDLDGRLVGINSRIGGSITSNIHVPIDTFEETWDRLAKGEEWGGARGLLAGGEGDDSLAEGTVLGISGKPDPHGVLVHKVRGGMPAQAAGFQKGDVVVKFAGHEVRGADDPDDKRGVDDLEGDVKAQAPGDRVKVEVLRAGKRVELTVQLGALH
jgi:serine protease Do